MNIKNNFTNGKIVSPNEYLKMLLDAKTIPLKRSTPQRGLVNNIRDIMEKMTEFEINKDKLPNNYDDLAGDMSIMNHILNDAIVVILLKQEDKIPEILSKYRDENDKRLFNDQECSRFVKYNFDDTRDFINGVLNVHKVMNKLSKKNNDPIIGGSVMYTPHRNKIIVDYSSLNEITNNILRGGKDCDCPCTCSDDIESLFIDTGKVKSDIVVLERLKPEVNLLFGGSEIVNMKNKLDSNVNKLNSKVDSLDSFINDGEEKMKKLINAEGDLSDDDKTQFDWIHWRFYKLWTLEKLHPVLTFPFDMVDPIIKSVAVFVKKILTPILSKFISPTITFLWQTLGTVINASSMIPFVGIATGAIAAVHSQLTTPIMMLATGAAELIQLIIDGMADLSSMVFNLQRKNWASAFESFLTAFQANGIYQAILGQVKALTIILKKMNNILDKVSEYPNIADGVLDKLNSSPKFMEALNKIDYVVLEKNLKRIIQIGMGLSKALIKITNGIVFMIGLPDSLIDKPKNKKGGGTNTELSKEFITLAFSPLNTEKLSRFNQLYDILYNN